MHRAHRRGLLRGPAAPGAGAETLPHSGGGQRQHPEKCQVRGGAQYRGPPGSAGGYRRGRGGRGSGGPASGHRPCDGGRRPRHRGLSGQHGHPHRLPAHPPDAGHPAHRLDRRRTPGRGPCGQQPHQHYLCGAGRGGPAGKAPLRLRRGQFAGQERAERPGYPDLCRDGGRLPHRGLRGPAARMQHRHRPGGPAGPTPG